jgi:hypothetical protein
MIDPHTARTSGILVKTADWNLSLVHEAFRAAVLGPALTPGTSGENGKFA